MIALELMHRTDEALKEVAEIQSRWPEWDKTYVIQGIILNINKKPAEARRALEVAVALGADTPEAYYYLALSITESSPDGGQPARQAIAAALELNGNDAYIRALAGKLAYADGDYSRAIDHLQQAIRIYPDLFQAHYNLANVYRAAGDEEKALAEMKEVRRIREGRSQAELELQAPPMTDVLFRVGR